MIRKKPGNKLQVGCLYQGTSENDCGKIEQKGENRKCQTVDHYQKT